MKLKKSDATPPEPRKNPLAKEVRSTGKRSDYRTVNTGTPADEIEALRESEEKHRTLFETISCGVVYQNAEGIIFSVNTAAERILGLTVDQILGRTDFDHQWQAIREDGSNFSREMHPAIVAMKTGKEVRDVVMGVFNPAKKEHIWLNVTAIPLFRPGEKKPYQVYTTFDDITKHKQAEKTLQESEKRYRSLFENMINGFAYCKMVFDNDRPGDFIYLDVNNAFEKLTGLKDVVGKKVSEVIPGLRESSPELFEAYARVARGGQPERLEFHVPQLDLWLDISVYSPEKDHFITVFDNITERKRSEEQLKLVNRLYALLSDINQAIVRIKERELLFKEICKIAVETGKFRMAWIGLVDEESGVVRPVVYFGHEDGYLNTFSLNIKATGSNAVPAISVIQKGKVAILDDIEADTRVPWREQALRRGYRSLAVVPLKLKGKFMGNFSMYADKTWFFTDKDKLLLEEIGTDISYALDAMETDKEHKRAEEELANEAIRRRILVEQSRDGIVVLDENGGVYEANQQFARMLGYSPEEVMGLHMWDWDAQWTREQLLGMAHTVTEAGDHFETKHRRKDGTVFDVEISTNGAIVAGQKLIFCVCRDITERKRTEEELQKGYEKLQKTVEGAIEAIAVMAETRDPYTAGHQKRVSKLASAIAREMGMTEDRIDLIRIAGLLHDIGKVSVPAEILSKPTKLSQMEIELIRTHPNVSREILKTMELPLPICPIVLQHHERMDGSGYPKGLTGKDILLESRILAVADVVEAMASHRPYRPAYGIEKALEEIRENRGRLYDSDAVDACIRLFTEKDFKFD